MKNIYSTKPVSSYTCKKVNTPINIDGDLTKDIWQKAEKTIRFKDVIDSSPALFDTRSAVLWDDEYLYVGFWCEEPYIKATLTERDSLVFSENDLEIFIDGGDTYYEFQINALNTIYEVFYIWKDAYEKGGKYDIPEFDVFSNNTVTFGGNHDRKNECFWRGTHPRQLRWAFLDWDMEGIKTAVKLDGNLNDENTISKGWTAEIAIPWASMKWLANTFSMPPKEGEFIKMFLGRYQICRLNGQDIQVGWAIDEIGTNDNHAPERFTKLNFSEQYID